MKEWRWSWSGRVRGKMIIIGVTEVNVKDMSLKMGS